LTDFTLEENNQANTILVRYVLLDVFKWYSIATRREVVGLEKSRKAEEVT
jgi:hypothetical protein